jgi:metal-responsive CopG/Arc/MetJ family transcriptional regulator
MKTAISIPDPVFQAAESLAKRLGVSRSELYAKAVSEYTDTHKQQNVTQLLNEVYKDKPKGMDDILYELQVRSLTGETW